ncbi:hypothetical protein TUMEXPCC7403_10480 [Tumidithrix helvetica PCC 7403]|uniref:hypothetical protein n=1 Tax=Tumidithrix helvetica TaxID=3457545 RepID=UPI003C93CC60
MSLETLFTEYRIPIIFLMLATPWLTYLICYAIPGKKEEPFVLSANLWLSVLSMLTLAGYLTYATHTKGWEMIVKQADAFLLFIPPYHLITSLWLSKQRLPLIEIPAFRTLQGLIVMAGVYMVLAWIASATRIYIIVFSFLPFPMFLGFLALLVGIGYLGYRRTFGT